MNDTRLLYVADPLCSWCYGFGPVLEQLRTEFDLPVDVLAGGLRPGPSAQAMDASMMSYLVQAWDRVEQATGLPFARTQLEWEDWVYDTEMPDRAVVAARSMDRASALPLFDRIQRAFYAEGVDVTVPESLVALARDSGLDPATFEELLLSERNKAETYADFQAARQIGITGFPALLAVHGSKAWALSLGYQPVEPVRQSVEEALAHFDEEPDET